MWCLSSVGLIGVVLMLQFKEISKAYSILSDERKKAIYDQYGMKGIQIAEQLGEDVS